MAENKRLKLFIAFQKNDELEINKLLEEGASLFPDNYRYRIDDLDITPEMVKYTLDRGETNYNAALVYAILNENEEIFNLCINLADDIVYAYKKSMLIESPFSGILRNRFPHNPKKIIWINANFEQFIRDWGEDPINFSEIRRKYKDENKKKNKKIRELRFELLPYYNSPSHHLKLEYNFIDETNNNCDDIVMIHLYKIDDKKVRIWKKDDKAMCTERDCQYC